MTTITFKGTPVHTIGTLPAVGSKAPGFKLTKQDLSDVGPGDFADKTLVINIVPSLDTGICALSAKHFEKALASRSDVQVLNVSYDLPFAQARFCKAEGINTVITLSALRSHDFGSDWGVEMTDGPLAGLLSRAVVIVDSKGIVRYSQQVPEIAQEPDYAAVLAQL